MQLRTQSFCLGKKIKKGREREWEAGGGGGSGSHYLRKESKLIYSIYVSSNLPWWEALDWEGVLVRFPICDTSGKYLDFVHNV